MEIDVSVDNVSLNIDVENPYRIDMESVLKEIDAFSQKVGIKIDDLDIEGIIQRMIKGVAGCEHGCPADAKGLVYRGYGKYELNYVDGGILSAVHTLDNGKKLEIKVFPGF